MTVELRYGVTENCGTLAQGDSSVTVDLHDGTYTIDASAPSFMPSQEEVSVVVDGGPNRPPMEGDVSAVLFALAVECAEDLAGRG